MKWLAATFLILFSSVGILAQTAPVIENNDDSLVFKHKDYNDASNFHELDISSIDGFQHYRPFGRNRLPFARSGNIGLAAHSYLQAAQTWTVESHLYGYAPYLLNRDSMRLYSMTRPLTLISYANGAEAEQSFQAFHSQNLGEGLNISFRYDRITSEGFFSRQLTNHTRFHTSYDLRSRNSRYKSKGYFYINTLEAQENGGILESDNDNPDDNTILLDVNLRVAQNRLRTQGLAVDQSYVVLQSKDSSDLLNLGYEIEWVKAYRNYNDDFTSVTDRFYQLSVIDSLRSADTTYAEQLNHRFKASLLENRIQFEYRLADIYYFQNYLLEEELQSHFIKVGFTDTIIGGLLDASFEKGLSGFQSEEVDFNASYARWINKRFYAKAFAELKEKQADFFLIKQRANHSFYDNNLETSKSQLLGVFIKDTVSRSSISIKLNNQLDWIYYDSNRDVNQESNSIQTLQLVLSKHFSFLRNFNLYNQIAYQSVSNQDVIPLPELFSYHSLYYANEFFKSSLRVQVGVDFYHIGKYKGYAYDPALSQFILRNPTTKDLGNINQVDLFLNFALKKSARFFLKFENLLSSPYDEGTYRVQDLPIPGRAFKMGFSWRMIN